MNKPSLPVAIREDECPLGLLAHFVPFLAFVRWTSYRCPQCGEIFRKDFWPHNVRLGNGARVCRSCSAIFDDEAREWPELPANKKLRFLFPPLSWAFAVVLLFCGMFMIFAAPGDTNWLINWFMGTVVIIFWLSPILLWSFVRLIWISRSKQRYRGKKFELENGLLPTNYI